MTARRRKMRHPAVSLLAQFAGDDLSWVQAFSMKRHLRACGGCAEYVDGIRSAGLELKREADLQTLTAFEAIADFPSLEREMSGNITVGLAAARCVEMVERHHPWRIASLVTAGLCILFAAGWWTHIPPEETRGLVGRIQQWAGNSGTFPQSAGTIMRSSPDGIAVRSQGLTLTMRHPRSAIVSVAGSGVMEARFVDDETGQVTISSVYGQ